MRDVNNSCRRTTSAADTAAIGRELAAQLMPGDVVLLFGGLGAGKTCLVRGLAAGLGIDPSRVHSPTFILVCSHPGERPLNHIDLYRLEPGDDFTDLDLEGLFAGPGITVVEWAERLPDVLRPQPRLEITLEHAGGEERDVTLRVVE